MEENLNKNDVENNIAKSFGRHTVKNRKKKKSKKGLTMLLGTILGIILCVLIVIIVLDKNNENNGTKTTENKSMQSGQTTSTLDEMMEEKGMEIETTMVSLYYPKKWEKQIHVEQIKEEESIIQFWGTIKGKDAVQLFDIVFGKTEGALVGTINETEVYLIHKDISFDDNWSEEERNEIYAMQEDVNYIIAMLQKEPGFVPAS